MNRQAENPARISRESPAAPRRRPWGIVREVASNRILDPQPLTGFTCGEVRGGTDATHTQVALPGMHGVLYSRPCAGANGGDIHYLSICGSGLMARVCLADVAGHGAEVAAIGAEMYDHLRRSVDVIDERKVLRQFDRRLEARALRTMTTAVLATYYPPRRRLTVCYAGHPPGFLYRSADRAWMPLHTPVPAPPRPAFVDLPLGTGLTPTFTRHRFRVTPGDRMLLFTDGVLETTSPLDEPFDMAGIARLLSAHDDACDALADRLLDALHAHADADRLVHDDVTFLLTEFEPGPAGPALWHVVKNRMFR
jgi:serine phosphatase RsbU (regulator of sigma subunit)